MKKNPPIETGSVYHRLTVISLHHKRLYNKVFLCKCLCGNDCIVEGHKLNSGHTKSCGCLHSEMMSETRTKHGYTSKNKTHKLYAVWRNMKSRCLNKNVGAYKNYGGRGITICNEWVDSFEVFAEWANKNGWSEGLEIDRRENNGNYCPENCRFVTPSINQFNTRRSLNSLAERCRKSRIEYDLVKDRIGNGWDVNRAMNTPKRQRKKMENKLL